MSDAAGPAGAALMLVHAQSLRDVPRLRQVAQTTGDRAVAVAKRMQRDGRLARASRGKLQFTRDLTLAILVAVIALLGLAVLAGAEARHDVMRAWNNVRQRFTRGNGALVHDFDRPWRAL
jgi:hypothetical protein